MKRDSQQIQYFRLCFFLFSFLLEVNICFWENIWANILQLEEQEEIVLSIFSVDFSTKTRYKVHLHESINSKAIIVSYHV